VKSGENHFSIKLPPPLSSSGEWGLVESGGSIVVVGANGSGKTRLGVWIELESERRESTYRITAQKSLLMPESAHAHAVDLAERTLWYGHERATSPGDRLGHRWHGKPILHSLNDFDALMVFLFSDQAEKNEQYRQQAKSSKERVEPPETKLDIVKRIWEAVLPTRELVIRAGKVETRLRRNPTSYNAAEMSDGERVVFYLIGQCLAAPPKGIIIIDEPELHLHKSIQSRIWNEVEAERPDCLFVYLTHDLEFAAGRRGATKVWLKEFDGRRWDWCVVPNEESVPDEMFLTLIGSRKPILFVEGDRGSWDSFLYSRIYPDFTVVPCNNAEGVLHATVSFAARKDLHALECRGIIDRDHRSEARVENLMQSNVYAANVSEVENLFLVEGVLRAIAVELVVRDVEATVARVKDKVFEQMHKERERLISSMTAAEIEYRMSRFDAKATGETSLDAALGKLVAGINVRELYAEVAANVDRILSERNYPEAIRVYNNKGLLHEVGRIFGSTKEFPDYLERLVASKKGVSLIDAMRKVVPVIIV
jgi:hypothetical protein